jgi:hypothetical protein
VFVAKNPNPKGSAMNPAHDLLRPATISWIASDIRDTITDTRRVMAATVADLGYGLIILHDDANDAVPAVMAQQYAMMVRAQATALRHTGAVAQCIDDDFCLDVDDAATMIDAVAVAMDQLADSGDADQLRDALGDLSFYSGKG